MVHRVNNLLVRLTAFACAALLLLSLGGAAHADDKQIVANDNKVPFAYRNVGVVEHLGRSLPLDDRFFDDGGQPVTFRELLVPRRPMILQLGYLGCPMLCDTISRSLVDAATKMNLDVGRDFDYTFVSIDPTDTPQVATLKRNSYIAAYNRGPSAAAGFHILLGQPKQIADIANAVGFGFKAADNGQFAHPAVAMVITPQGKISRYFYGVTFNPVQLQQALVDASQEKVTNSLVQILLVCLQLDPNAKNVAWCMHLMQVGGILTIMVLGSAIFLMSRRHGHLPASSDSDFSDKES